MKPKWIALVVGLVALIAIFMAVRSTEPRPGNVSFVFVGFTNIGAGPEAVFSVQLPPQFGGCGYGKPQVSRKEGETWREWSVTNSRPPRMRLFNTNTQPAAGALEQPADGYAAILVETTNAVSRIVITVDEMPRRIGRLEVIARRVQALIRNKPFIRERRKYSITNETVFAPVSR